ncbi:MAG: hypothetical protein JW395_2523 [Nitrospira sp.]|nr:hypothetical protein [Nitrospira sp.]
MPGKRNLLCRGKDPEANDRRLVRRRQHEHGLGKVHLPGNLLQLMVGEAVRVGKYSDRVAAEWVIGEHVSLIKLQQSLLRHGLILCAAAQHSGILNVRVG